MLMTPLCTALTGRESLAVTAADQPVRICPEETRPARKEANVKAGILRHYINAYRLRCGRNPANGALCAFIAGFLVPLDCLLREVIIRERGFSLLDLIHDPCNRRWRGIGHLLNEARILAHTLIGLGLDALHDVLDEAPKIAHPFPQAHVVADTLRINDFITPHHNLGEIFR